MLSQIKVKEVEAIAEEFGLGDASVVTGVQRSSGEQQALVDTKKGKFVIYVHKLKSEIEVKQEIDLFLFLKRHGFHCRLPIKGKRGRHYHDIHGAYFSVSKYMDGTELSVEVLSPNHLVTIGHTLAELHLIGRSYKKGIDNRFSFPKVAGAYQEVRKNLPAHLKSIVRVLDDEIAYLEAYLDNNLPKGIIHGNLGTPSLRFKGSRLVAVLDFEAACRGKFIYDLATTVNATCYHDGRYRLDRFESVIVGYEELRPLSLPEWDSFPNELRFSALRFAISSLKDFYSGKNGQQQRVQKEFKEYFERLLILRREKEGGMEDLLLSMATGYDYRKYQKSKPSK